MAKWYENIRRRKESKNYKRFYTQLDMAEIKRMESIANSEVKRGIRANRPNYYCVCGCGTEGCFIVAYAEGKLFEKRKN